MLMARPPDPVRVKSWTVEIYALGTLILIAAIIGVGRSHDWRYGAVAIAYTLAVIVLCLIAFRLLGRWLGGR
jgi:hypothetical protein